MLPALSAAEMQETAEEGTVDYDSDGASARTSKTHQEDMIFGLESLLVDSKQILKFLTAENFSATTIQSFQQPNTRASKKLQNLLARLRDSCETFGGGDDLIPLEPISTRRKILGGKSWPEYVNGTRWQPEAVFQLANLAKFTAALVGPDARSSSDMGVLHIMWEEFPRPFTAEFEEAARNDGTKWGSKFLEKTFELGLEIRTQYAISLLSERRSDLNFDPDVVLDQVFTVKDNKDTTQYLGVFINGLYRDHSILPNKFESYVSQRIQAIRVHFSEHAEGSVDIDSLTDSFSWETFLAHTLIWVQARAAELGQEIDDQGGISKIQQSLLEENNQPRPANERNFFEEQHEAPKGSGKRVQSPKNESAAVLAASPLSSRRQKKTARKSLVEQAIRLKQLKAQRADGSSVNADALREEVAVFQGDFEASAPLVHDSDEPPASSLAQLVADPSVRMSPVARVYTTIEKQSRQSNKENIYHATRPKAFIDAQKGAQKVPWSINSQELPSGIAQNEVLPRKRPRNTEHADGEDDENAFETTTSALADSRRKELSGRTGQSTTQRISSKRSRAEIQESIDAFADANDDVDNSAGEQNEVDQQLNNALAKSRPPRSPQRPVRSSRPRHQAFQQLPPSTQPARFPLSPRNSNNSTSPSSSVPASTARHLERVRESARRMVAINVPRRVQSRMTYSRAEEERLIELIEEYGSSYAYIKQMDERHPDGPLLLERSQVHLKDKAQELKFQLLKSVSTFLCVCTLSLIGATANLAGCRARAILPVNFERIPLRRRMREQLEGLGIYQGY